MEIEALTQKLVIPDEFLDSVIYDSEAVFIHDFITTHKCRGTLEIGLATGKSACAIMTASHSRHVVMDPWQEKDFGNIGLMNIERIGMREHLEFYQEFSHLQLPKLLAAGRKFDFIFIDGSHLFDHTFIDFYYSDLLLHQDGYILFHDAWMRSVALVHSFIHRNRKCYSRVKTPSHNLVLLKKTGTDDRGWDHFREFFTMKSFLKFHVGYRYFDKLFSGKKNQ